MDRNKAEQWHKIMSAEGSTNVPFPEITELESFDHSVADYLSERWILNNNYNPYTQGI